MLQGFVVIPAIKMQGGKGGEDFEPLFSVNFFFIPF